MYEDRFDPGEWTYACRFGVGGDPEADYDRHLAAEAAAVARAAEAGRRLAILIVLDPGAPGPSAPVRKRVAEMTSRPEFGGIACAIVTRNPIIRGVVTALNWWRPRRYAERLIGTLPAGLDWLEAERGEPLPALRAAVAAWA